MRFIRILMLSGLVAGTLALNTGAYAQAVPIPHSAQADTVARQAESISQQQPSAPIMIEQTPLPLIKAPAGSEKAYFVLKSVVIENGSVYGAAQLQETYKGLTGKKVSLADMYQVAARITQRYHQDGYVLATAYLPPQKIGDGVVHIGIIEGYVAHVSWSGAHLDSKIARNLADRLSAMRPFNGNTLEEVMIRLNELPSVIAKATIAPYKGADAKEGAVEIQIAVERKHVSAQASVNDYGSRYLGVWQDSLQANVGGIFSQIDQLSVNTSSSVDPQYSRYVRGEYSIPLTTSGTIFKFGANKSYSAPGYTLEALDVRSNGSSGWVGFSQPLIRSRAESLSVDGQFEMNKETTDELGVTSYKDRLRVLRLSTNYSLSDAWGGANLVTAGLGQGLDILNATDTGSSDLSRPYGHSNFTDMTISASRLQDINRYFNVLAAFSGQASDSPLLSSEQFGFGGSAFGRAYDVSEISGDDGMAGSLELRYLGIAPVRDFTFQPFAFYDIGKVWNRSPGGDIMSAASAGGGVRLQASTYSLAEFMLAKPLTLEPSAPKLGETDKDVRVGVSLKLFY